MDYNLPKTINNESDLDKYECYINNCSLNKKSYSLQNYKIEDSTPKTYTNNAQIMQNGYNQFFAVYLKNHIGKLVKVDSLLGNHFESRTGTLLDVGIDYIVIKLNMSCCSTVIPTSTVKYITIAHDNDIRKLKPVR